MVGSQQAQQPLLGIAPSTISNGAIHIVTVQQKVQRPRDLCRHWAKGYCNRGTQCGFSHEGPSPAKDHGRRNSSTGSVQSAASGSSGGSDTSLGSSFLYSPQEAPCAPFLQQAQPPQYIQQMPAPMPQAPMQPMQAPMQPMQAPMQPMQAPMQPLQAPMQPMPMQQVPVPQYVQVPQPQPTTVPQPMPNQLCQQMPLQQQMVIGGPQNCTYLPAGYTQVPSMPQQVCSCHDNARCAPTGLQSSRRTTTPQIATVPAPVPQQMPTMMAVQATDRAFEYPAGEPQPVVAQVAPACATVTQHSPYAF